MRTGELGFARTAGLSLLGIACLFCGACERSQERVAEAPIPRNGTPFAAPRTNPPGVPAAPLMPLPEASVRDVQELLARVFAGVVALDSRSSKPFWTGDFNGDGSEDVAVLAAPVTQKLAELNDPLSNWIVQDPHNVFVPPPNQSVVTLPPPTKREVVRAGEHLLVVVHGVGPSGWRNPIARQTFVLCHAAGLELAVAHASRSLQRAFGSIPNQQNVIAENVGGETGALVWTGAGYAWHPEPGDKSR
ncbi:MAG TPA: hypothetical protein VFA89_13610 [Terriglobales bacterium]|nr:hypothetical protein [Terriglobales bacterium]